MTHILERTLKRKEVVGIAADLFCLIKLLAGSNNVMTKTPWSCVYQGFSESHSYKAALQCFVKSVCRCTCAADVEFHIDERKVRF